MSYKSEQQAILDSYASEVELYVDAAVRRVGIGKAISAMEIATEDGALVPDIFICNLGDGRLLEQYMAAKDRAQKKLDALDYKYTAEALMNYLYERD